MTRRPRILIEAQVDAARAWLIVEADPFNLKRVTPNRTLITKDLAGVYHRQTFRGRNELDAIRLVEELVALVPSAQ